MEKINLDKGIYTLDVIYSAAYSLTDEAYFLFDESGKDYLVMIYPKQEGEIKVMFLDALLKYLNHSKRVESTKDIRKMILQRALLLGEDGYPDKTYKR